MATKKEVTPKNKRITKTTSTKAATKKVATKTVKTPAKSASKSALKTPVKTTKPAPKKVTKPEVVKKKVVAEPKVKANGLLYDVDETPPLNKWIVLAIQHVFAMFGATILVPVIVNSAVGTELIPIPVALFTSGVGTIIYLFCSQRKSPLYLGSSFAFIAPMIAGYGIAGLSGVMTGLFTAGIIYLLVSLGVKFAGSEWLRKLIPPIIIGPMVMIIGFGLAYVPISQIGLNGVDLEWKNLLVGLVAFLVTIVVALYAKGFFKIIPFISGIVAGYILAAALGMIDFKPIADASLFSLPNFNFIFADWNFSWAAALTIAPVAIVTLAEHIGDHIIMSDIVGRDLTKDPGLARTLLGDGLATSVAAMFGGPASTSYGENLAVVGISKVGSTKVVGLAAIIAILFAFIGKLGALISTIPAPVLGGVSIILFGFIGVAGLRVLVKNQVDFGKTKNIVLAATMLVLALGGAVISFESGNFHMAISGMALAAVVGIVLNLLLPDKESEIS